MVPRSFAIAALVVSLVIACAGRQSASRDPVASASPSTSASDTARPPVNGVRVELVPQSGHEEDVEAVAFSPDGRRLLSGGADHVVRLWDVATGQLVRAFYGHTDRVDAVAFSPDGKQIASGSWDKSARLWNLMTGQSSPSMPHGDMVSSVAFRPDGNSLVTGSMDGQVRAWSVGASPAPRTIISDLGAIRSVVVSNDGTKVLVGSSQDEIHLVDIETGRVLSKIAAGQEQVHSVALTPDAQRAVSGGRDGSIRLWDLATRKLLRKADVDRSVYPVALSPDGRRALAGGLNGSIFSWEIDSDAPPRELGTHPRTVMGLAFSPDGRLAASASWDRTVRIWDVATAQPIVVIDKKHDRPYSVAVSRDGRRAITGTGGHMRAWELHVWDVDSLRQRMLLMGHENAINAVDISADASLAVSGDHGGSVRLWDLERGVMLRELRKADQDPIYAVAFTPDGKHIAAAGNAGSVTLWDTTTGAVTKTIDAGRHAIQTIAFCADGSRMAIGTFEATVVEVATGRRLHTLKGDLASDVVALSPDGRLALVSSYQAPPRLFDVDRGALLRSFGEKDHDARFLAFSSDGARAFTADGDDIRTWDVSSGAQLGVRTLADHSELAVTPDGAFVFGTMNDGTLRAMRLATGDTLAMLASGEEWLVYSNDGYFDASRRGGELVAAVRGLDVFRVDQLAIRNNRPDLLLERLGIAPPALVSYYRARHERRVARVLHGTTLSDAFDRAPEVRIVDVVRDGETAKVTFEISDAGAGLASYAVFVNDVPVFAGSGKPASGAKARITESIELAPGRNKIEVSALGRSGIESLRPYRVIDSPRVAKGALYFIGFGVSRYKNTAYDLKYAHKDALDLANVLRGTTGFREVHVTTYVDDQATAENVRKARALVASTKVEDTVVVFIAGHGVHSKDGQYYFGTHEIDVKDLAHTAARFETVEELLQGIGARRKLLLMDTCESGEDDGERVVAAAAPGTRGMRARTTRALKLETDTPSAPAQRVRVDRDRFIENDLSRRTGAIVLSSSRGSELSYEFDDIQNGAFTAELVTALTTTVADGDKDGWVSTDELRRYVSGAVATRTADRQHPTIDRDNLEQRVALPRVTP